MELLDTHLHLVYKDRFSYPWIEVEDVDYPWLDGAPSLNRSFKVDEYFDEAAVLGVVSALHMEVDVAESDMEAETKFVLDLDPRICGAIAACRPESAGFRAYAERMAALKGVRGVRRILHTEPDETSQTKLYADNLNHLPALGLTYDLCMQAHQLPLGRKLVDRCPDVQFILDHCGWPDVTGGRFDPWRAEISEMAKRPNVVAKVSGIVAYSGRAWSVSDIKPYIEHIIESFGWDRVVWGSDHPVCTLTSSLAQWVTALKTIVAGEPVENQSKLFSRNARRIYGL
jgi:predicted TIM-barrel fold metal-dependent hydrolase